MARPEVTLRNVKGSALTFNEMDKNFSSFFYSASVVSSTNGNKLRLFYTGSNEFSFSGFTPGVFTEVFLPSAEQNNDLVVPGENGDVFFNTNDALDVRSRIFNYNTRENFLGVGTEACSTLHLKTLTRDVPTNAKLQIGSGEGIGSTGYLSVSRGRDNRDDIFRLGKLMTGNRDIIRLNTTSQLSLGTSGGNFDEYTSRLYLDENGVTIGRQEVSAVSPLSVEGNITVGSDFSLANINTIGNNTVTSAYLPVSSVTNGLLLQSPKSNNGGHVVVGINSDANKRESFTIAKGIAGSFDCAVATFKADGNVGIGCKDPTTKLDVAGAISASGDIHICGDATIHTIAEKASLTTDWAGSTTEYSKTLVAEVGTGLVKYMDASPVPKGGIIMWSGAPNNVPKGWTLCNGTDVNNVTVPDLRNKFIVAASSTGATATVEIDGVGCICTTGGCNVHSHFNSTGGTILKECHLPAHSHGYNDAYYAEARSGVQYNVRGDADGGSTDGDNEFFWRTRDNDGQPFGNPPSGNDQPLTEATGSGCAHAHTIMPHNNIPEYFALAFIIYVGVE